MSIPKISTFNKTQYQAIPSPFRTLLRLGETLIKAAPDLIGELEKLSAKAAKRKNTRPELLETIKKDIQRIKDDRVFPGADRYIDLIYPFAAGWDYFPPDALVVLCE